MLQPEGAPGLLLTGTQLTEKLPLPGGFSVSEKELQPSSLKLKFAACEGCDTGAARKAAVIAAAAVAPAAGRKSDRIIFDSQAEGRSGGPFQGTCNFRASNYNENNQL
jgi:hypothetical protein